MPPAHNGPELAEQPHEVAVRADRYALDGDVCSVTAILREHRHEILASATIASRTLSCLCGWARDSSWAPGVSSPSALLCESAMSVQRKF